MLSVVGILEKSKFTKEDAEVNKNVLVSKLDAELREILDGMMSILDSELPKGESTNFKYALFVEYRKKTDTPGDPENIFSITSEENVSPELSNKGLIYNMLYGLYDEKCDSRYEKTIVAAVKLADQQILSIREHYYVKGNDTDTASTFSQLYTEDYYNQQTGRGLQLLQQANMALVIRLSNVNQPFNDRHTNINGRAVLVVTSPNEATVPNFMDFMNMEKIRLLLLLRDEFLGYLDKQFNNDAFMEVLEARKVNAFEKNLKHGLVGYTNIIRSLLYEYNDEFVKKNKKDLDLLQIVLNAFNGQLVNYEKLDSRGDDGTYSGDYLISIFKLMFESNKFNRYVDFALVDISDFDIKSITLNKVIVNVIIPELVINMKKYSPKIGNGDFKISYVEKPGQKIIRFQNKLLDSIHFDKSKPKPYGGISMSEKILRNNNLGLLKPIPDTKKHIVELIINVKDNE
jgi:hypothetical protein